eukprot:m.479370 g.479370  ORF g.479370 m.479370 type:complete len:61 (+) comp49615_c0_seq1:285-467(+)
MPSVCVPPDSQCFFRQECGGELLGDLDGRGILGGGWCPRVEAPIAWRLRYGVKLCGATRA